MAHHDLKIHTQFFDKVVRRVKKAEVRVDDRGYQVGDTASLKEYLPELGKFTGASVDVKITDVSKLESIGIKGFVLFSFDVEKEHL